MKINIKIFPTLLMVLFTVFIWGSIVNAMIGESDTNHSEIVDTNMHENNVEVIIEHGPFDGLQRKAGIKLENINTINMYQEKKAGGLVKVILGTLREQPEQYVLAIVFSDEDGTEQSEPILRHLSKGMGENVRIVGVGRGERFFLQNENGNEFLYYIDWNSENYDVTFLKSCKSRCD